jgi:hypothetical protein
LREDSRVELFLICGFIFVAAWNGVLAFWQGTDDSEWKARWDQLDDLDRAWLAAASRSRANRAALMERGELDLAKGFGRREARHRAKISLMMLPLFGIGAALILSGLLSDRFATAIFVSFVFLQSIVASLRDRKIKVTYRKVQDEYLAIAAAPEPAPTT